MDANSDEYRKIIPPGPVIVLYGPSAATVRPASRGQRPTAAIMEVPPASPTVQNLSRRQRQVFEPIVQGRSNKEIACTLKLAEGTVKIHIAALSQKLGVHRGAAVAVADVAFWHRLVATEQRRHA